MKHNYLKIAAFAAALLMGAASCPQITWNPAAIHAYAYSSPSDLEAYAMANWCKPIHDYYEEITGGRTFGASRSGGRAHAGIDYVCDVGTPVYAMEEGEVISFSSEFYCGTQAVGVQHPDGSVARYCEIETDLREGDWVSKGQIIGYVIANTSSARSHMLHLEMYLGTADGYLTEVGNYDYWYLNDGKYYKRRADLIDPTFTQYLKENPKHTVTIHYHANGGAIDEGGDYYVAAGGAICQADGSLAEETWEEDWGHPNGLYNASTFGLYKDNADFTGWSLSPDSGRIYGEDEAIVSNDLYPDVTNESAVIDLYARWDCTSLTIRYNAYGGTIESGGNFYVGDGGNIYNADDTITEEVWERNWGHPNGLYNAFTFGLTRRNCEFLGWSLAEESGRIFGEDEAILSNDLYPDIVSQSGSVTLYAQWGGHLMNDSEGAGYTLPDGKYWIANALAPDYIVHPDGDMSGADVRMNLYDSSKWSQNDLFTVHYLGNGFYSIVQDSTGMAVSTESDSLRHRTNIVMMPQSNAATCQWSIEPTDGGYRIRSRSNALYFDVKSDSTDNSTLQTFEATNVNSQIFQFEVAQTEPAFSSLTADKTELYAGETVTFTAESDTADMFSLMLEKDGEEYLQQEMPGGVCRVQLQEGSYTAYVSAYNTAGQVYSEPVSLNVNPYNVTLNLSADERHQIVYTETGLSYKTSDEDVAIVSKSGVICPISAGEAIVSVIDSEGNVRQIHVTVTQNVKETEPEITLLGDVNADGEMNVKDAVLLSRVIAGDSTAEISAAGLVNADVDGSEGLTTGDLTVLLKVICKLITL
jgi:hypothetical protein